MSFHHSIVEQISGLHVEHQCDTLTFDPDGVNSQFKGIVRLDEPSRSFDRGEGTAHRGQLLFLNDDDPGLIKGSKLVINGKVYMVERVDRPADGNNIAFLYGNSQDYTASNSATNRER